MSAFLGPIHTWLYNKINMQNDLVEELIKSAISEKAERDELKGMIARRYGELESGNLEEICDPNNIHGWLQERVSLVENRLAFVVTYLTMNEDKNIEKLEKAAYSFGEERTTELTDAKSAYKFLEDNLLNGMPCDRVNEVIYEEENQVLWRQVVDIHSIYWKNISGNMEYYNRIKESFINGLLSLTGLKFAKVDVNQYEIRR
ncbi:hypothetical protein [Lachnobacterium bovis]|uniref:hypothetical protein n=1 Tax=Lachnobacterium bovis TaxID=140626 RepID=UPI00048AF9ED|nr:hypothetical protein [Lachnobacterium bovis]